jgi:hypothetical protein
VYYHRVINQYKYFNDTSRLKFLDGGKSVGLPYHFDFKGMKAPWYSGMTQGTAVSFLLRYYQLTKNKDALDLSEKLINLLLKPEKEGGTIGRTAEGGMWIEEYPRSTGAKSVLNGFINGFVGLHEYCTFFPKDLRAAAVRDSCYAELIKTVGKYDTHSWTSYNRNGTPISNSYIRYQLEEFDHLYTIFRDERFRDQMKIWAKFAFNKPDNELKFLKQPNYQFGIPIAGDPATDSCRFSDLTAFSKGLAVAKPVTLKKNSASFRFDTERYYTEIKVLSQDFESKKVKVTATFKGEKVAVTCTYSDKRVVAESQTPFDALVVKYPKQKTRKSCPVVVSTYDHRNSPLALFGFYPIKKMENLQKGKPYAFASEGENMTNAKVFYRYATAGKNVEQSKYSFEQCFKLNGEHFNAPETGTYQFFISYDLMHPTSALRKLRLITE